MIRIVYLEYFICCERGLQIPKSVSIPKPNLLTPIPMPPPRTAGHWEGWRGALQRPEGQSKGVGSGFALESYGIKFMDNPYLGVLGQASELVGSSLYE